MYLTIANNGHEKLEMGYVILSHSTVWMVVGVLKKIYNI